MEIKYCIKVPALMQPQPQEEIQSSLSSAFFFFFFHLVKDDSHQKKTLCVSFHREHRGNSTGSSGDKK